MPHSNPIIRQKYQKNYYLKTKNRKSELARESRFRRIYGITSKEWNEIFEAQNKQCPICEKTEDSRWAVDHNHLTGEVRGILCGTCNRGMGYLKDNPEILIKAATYLHWFNSGRFIPSELISQT